MSFSPDAQICPRPLFSGPAAILWHLEYLIILSGAIMGVYLPHELYTSLKEKCCNLLPLASGVYLSAWHTGGGP